MNINDLIVYQRKNIYSDKKLFIDDMKRIENNISGSIFNSNNCVIWKGRPSKSNGNSYINFFLHKQKTNFTKSSLL